MTTKGSLRQLQDLLAGARQSTSKLGEYIVLCPACADRIGTPDETGNLGINLEKKGFNCFRCGWHGKLRELFSELDRLDLAPPPGLDLAKLRAPEPTRAPLTWTARQLPAGYTPVLPEDRDCMASLVLDYLHGRGYTDDEIRRLHPGYTEAAPARGEIDCRGRVIVPVVVQGQVVYWQARTWGSLEPKAIGPRLAAGESKWLWGIDEIPIGSWVVITEGIFDALATPHGVAGLGTALTDAQIQLLVSRLPRRVLLMYDPDDAGIGASLRNAARLQDRWIGEICRVTLPPGRDPGSFAGGRRSELHECISRAVPFTYTDRVRALAGKVR
jgi:hypothetical protein